MQPIILSLLDTDLYKFTMWQTMLHRHPQTQAEYSFVCRNQPGYPLTELLNDVNQQLDQLCKLRFQDDELAYLRGLRFIKSDFVDFLRIFTFQREFISARADGQTLVIQAKGPQVHTMAFEIFVLAIVNELYFQRFDQAAALTDLAESYFKANNRADARKQTLAALEIAPSYERAQRLLLELAGAR